MRRFRGLAALALAIVSILAGATAALAITNGRPDGSTHPYVGLMLALDANNVPLSRCSGALLSPRVFLTAAHCTLPPAAHVEIWFSPGPILTDSDYQAAQAAAPDGIVSCNDSAAFDGYPCQGDASGSPHPNPDFCPNCGHGLPNLATHDVGVVLLDKPVPTSIVGEYAQLPEPGLVATLANKTGVDFVGYGVQFQAKIPGTQLPKPPPFSRWSRPRQRLQAPSELVSGNFTQSDELLRLALNPGGGSGGFCCGDSGGPDLLTGSNTIIGVNSFVRNVNCSGVGYSQRIDLPDVLAWINSFG